MNSNRSFFGVALALCLGWFVQQAMGATCNYVLPVGSETPYAIDKCQSMTNSSSTRSFKATCVNSTDAMIQIWSNDECSGTAAETKTSADLREDGSTWECGKSSEQCTVVHAQSSDSCSSSSGYGSSAYMVTDVCAKIEDDASGNSAKITCSGSSVTQNLYESDDCSGDTTSTITVSSGCYFETISFKITCGTYYPQLSLVVGVVALMVSLLA